MAYWILEFIKVFIGYAFLMYVWPSVVFRKKLSGKSLTFRFAFCSTVSVLLLNTLVLGLGLLHILKEWIVFAAFYGIFAASILREGKLRRYVSRQLQTLLAGTLGWKSLLADLLRECKALIAGLLGKLDEKTKGKKIEYSILSVLMVFAIIYFSYGAFQNHSYGWGDMYVHHAWIYGLKEGRIFSAGVYPEAMHCFVYCMDALFGVSIYSCLLFLGEIHVTALLAAVYCLFRETLRSKYTVYLILAAFLTIDVVCVDEIYGISRLQYTIPQEFGLYTLFLCVMYLVRFMRRNTEDGNKKRGFDENLFLFMTSLAASLALHFYVTIMAFFLCASFAVFGINRIFRKRNFWSLAAAILVGVIISTTPMVLAFASGIPLQGSLNWGMNIINGTDTKEGRTKAAQVVTEQGQKTEENTAAEADNSEDSLSGQSKLHDQVKETDKNETDVEVTKTSLAEKIIQTVWDNIKAVYRYGYAQLYRGNRANWLIGFTLAAVLLSIINMGITLVRFKKIPFEMYAGITFASVLFMILYAAPFLGLPEIIAGARLCLPEQILLLAMMAIPADELFFLLEKTKIGCFMPQISFAGVLAIYAGTNYFGVFHGYLYYELTRYNSAVELTNKIMDDYPQYSYTIISTTEEMYQSIEDARHEEILEFYNRSKQEDYYIPTEYLFFYIEKNPIYYAQYHFFSGPRWLAQDKYTKYYEYTTAVLSIGDNIEHGEISEELVGESLTIMGKASDAYSIIGNRRILESEMYYWCQEFKTRFPYELKVYYEDEDFICYVVKQNPEHLYNLGE